MFFQVSIKERIRSTLVMDLSQNVVKATQPRKRIGKHSNSSERKSSTIRLPYQLANVKTHLLQRNQKSITRL